MCREPGLCLHRPPASWPGGPSAASGASARIPPRQQQTPDELFLKSRAKASVSDDKRRPRPRPAPPGSGCCTGDLGPAPWTPRLSPGPFCLLTAAPTGRGAPPHRRPSRWSAAAHCPVSGHHVAPEPLSRAIPESRTAVDGPPWTCVLSGTGPGKGTSPWGGPMGAASRLLFAPERSRCRPQCPGPLSRRPSPPRDMLLCSQAAPTGRGQGTQPWAAALQRLAGTPGERAPRSPRGRPAACLGLLLWTVPPPCAVHRVALPGPAGLCADSLAGRQEQPWKEPQVRPDPGGCGRNEPLPCGIVGPAPAPLGGRGVTSAASASGEGFRPSVAPATAPRGRGLQKQGRRGHRKLRLQEHSARTGVGGQRQVQGTVSTNGDGDVAPAAGPADLARRRLQGPGPYPGAHGRRPRRPRDLAVPEP